jgi:hypothetical protein
LELWNKYFSGFDLTEVDLEQIAYEYEITGGSIINVLRYCSILAADRQSNVLQGTDIIHGIRKEFLKEGATL